MVRIVGCEPSAGSTAEGRSLPGLPELGLQLRNRASIQAGVCRSIALQVWTGGTGISGYLAEVAHQRERHGGRPAIYEMTVTLQLYCRDCGRRIDYEFACPLPEQTVTETSEADTDEGTLRKPGRPRVYATNADRQRAYRERLKGEVSAD